MELTRAFVALDGFPILPAGARLNCYHCERCHAWITTIEWAPCVTPFLVRCVGCPGMMQSRFYPPLERWPTAPAKLPSHEWYRPRGKELRRLKRHDAETYWHVKRGGGLLRVLPQTRLLEPRGLARAGDRP